MYFNKHIERFITVAEKGSISEAARLLYLTQPALLREMHAPQTEWENSLANYWYK